VNSGSKTSITHTYVIETTGLSVSANARRFYLEKFKGAKEKFEYMMQQRLCKSSKSFWASSLRSRAEEKQQLTPLWRLPQIK